MHPPPPRRHHHHHNVNCRPTVLSICKEQSLWVDDGGWPRNKEGIFIKKFIVEPEMQIIIKTKSIRHTDNNNNRQAWHADIKFYGLACSGLRMSCAGCQQRNLIPSIVENCRWNLRNDKTKFFHPLTCSSSTHHCCLSHPIARWVSELNWNPYSYSSSSSSHGTWHPPSVHVVFPFSRASLKCPHHLHRHIHPSINSRGEWSLTFSRVNVLL